MPIKWLKSLVQKDKPAQRFQICETCGHHYDTLGRTGEPCKICPRCRVRVRSVISSVKTADLSIPAGVSADAVAERVANQITKTIIHEAEHGKRWAQEFYTNKQRLDQMNRTQEEWYSEEAERRLGLQTELTEDIFDDTSEERSMSNQELLDRAISIANSKSPFYIPRESVEDVRLPLGAWGMFEAIQRPGEQRQAPDPHVAWNEEKRKLEVDVTDIVESYNRALSGISERPRPPTFQDDGVKPDVPGISRQSPTSGSGSSTATPTVPAAPSRGAR